MQSCSLAAPNRYPITNAAQFFQGDSAMGALRSFNNAFADRMVDSFGETGLFATTLLQEFAGRPGALGL